MSAVTSRIQINKLHPLFVAEVTGIDLTVPISREDLNTIWQAFNEHEVLVFRNQDFNDDTQMAFSRCFGTLERMEAHAANNYQPGHIAVMTNLDKNGNMLPLDDPGMLHRLRNEAWHSDSSFKPVAALCSLLSAREVPPLGVGGNTDFASARAAYDALPATRKAQIENLTVIHRVAEPKNVDDPAYTPEQKSRLTVTHPLVRTNPVNGRKGLYVGSHAQEIIGMSPEAALALLEELTALCTQPQFCYSHPWLKGDTVMWDNRCTLHRATSFDKTKYRRNMHRTTVAGLAPDTLYARMPEQVAA